MTIARTPAAGAFPQELTELLLELALALQRYGMYPGGHPSVDAAVARLTEHLTRLLSVQPTLSLGVAHRQLVVEGVATETSHPVLRSLAERLHRHRLGAVVFRAGVDASELSDALRAVSVDPERSGEPLGTWTVEQLAKWPHVGLYRVTYEQLQLEDVPTEQAGEGGGATAQLWLGLAQAALAQEDVSGVDASPDAVARAINAHPAEQAYDQMIVGYLLQLSDRLQRQPDAVGAVNVRDRLSHMIRTLDVATLQRLLSMGGDAAQRQRFLNEMTSTLQPDAVLELVRAAAQLQGESISTSMLRLLRKLSAFADEEDETMSARAEEELRAQVHELLEGWSLPDPNPDAYTQTLEVLARESAADDARRRGSVYGAEPLRIVQMGIEVGATGMTFWRAVDDLIEAARLPEIFDIIDAADADNATVTALWRRFERTDHIRLLLTTDPVDFDSLDRIFTRLPSSSVISLLLDRISESASRATRMGIYKRLVALGLAAVPQIAERLHDERWFVVRNMLALLGEIDSWPADFSPLAYAHVEHAPVRREALLLAMRVPAEREQAICLALGEADERALRVGVHAARQYGLPQAAHAIVLQRLGDDALSQDARVALLRTLRAPLPANVIEALLALVLHRGVFGRTRLADASPVMLAGLAVLARSGSTDARVRNAVQLARKSADADIRTAVTAAP